MSVWLEQYKPVLFDDLLTSQQVIDALKHLSLQANPPHLLLSGPTGCGKTAALQLVCRQVLGPSWRATTHVLQARDLDKTSGAMAKFEAFLRLRAPVPKTPLPDERAWTPLTTTSAQAQMHLRLLPEKSQHRLKPGPLPPSPASSSSKMLTISVTLDNLTCAA